MQQIMSYTTARITANNDLLLILKQNYEYIIWTKIVFSWFQNK